jgi:hypothetical protein
MAVMKWAQIGGCSQSFNVSPRRGVIASMRAIVLIKSSIPNGTKPAARR